MKFQGTSNHFAILQKKFLIFAFQVTIFYMLFSITSYASFEEQTQNPILNKKISIFVETKLTQFKDIPITLNNRTMLPLREMLISFGVPNDDRHIAWNSSDATISILHNGKKIRLQVNNLEASTDDNKVTLEACPIIFNNKTYIPLRFIAQALGMKVVWDGRTETIYVRNPKDFEETLYQLNKIKDSISSEKNSVYSARCDFQLDDEQRYMNFNIDNLGKRFYIEYGLRGSQEMIHKVWQSNGTVYVANSDKDKDTWNISPKTSRDGEMISQILNLIGSTLNIKKREDIICASTSIEKKDNITTLTAQTSLIESSIYGDDYHLTKLSSFAKIFGTTKISFDSNYLLTSIEESSQAERIRNENEKYSPGSDGSKSPTQTVKRNFKLDKIVYKPVPELSEPAGISSAQGMNSPAENNQTTTEPSDLIGKPAPNIEVTDLSGNKVSLNSFKGKMVYINFFATWCPPCRGEMPDIEKIYNEYKQNPEFVLMVVDLSEDEQTVKKFAQDNNYTFDIYIDKTGSESNKYNVTGIPTSIFIDKGGNVVAADVGAVTYEKIKENLKKIGLN